MNRQVVLGEDGKVIQTSFVIPGFRPTLINEMLGNVGKRIRLKKKDRKNICDYAAHCGVPIATGKRRVSLHVCLAPRNKEFDRDAPWKSLFDALVHAKLLIDDKTEWVEQGTLTFERGAGLWSRITLEDLN